MEIFIYKYPLSSNMGLDTKDRKILYELEKDAKATNSEIAKKVILSKDAVGYRIKNLEEEGILRGYRTIIDLTKLNYVLYRVYFKLLDMSEIEQDEMISYLKQEKNTWWIAKLDGSWDFVFAFWGQYTEEFHQFYFEFSKKFRRFIKEKMISPIISYKEFPRRYLTESKEMLYFKEDAQNNSKAPVVDDKDIEILNTLSQNARVPLIVLAHKLKVDSKTITYRIKRLESQKIITGYKANLDVSKLGRDFYTIEIDLNDFSRFKEIENHILSLKELTGRSISIQGYDLEFDIEIENTKRYYDITKELKNKFKEIREIRYFRVIENHKLNYMVDL
jgi:Lrp/AsnC family transcriptional regulator, leucine-responsive regulatory protein